MIKSRPIIGITTHFEEDRYSLHSAYATAIIKTGGYPILIPPIPGTSIELLPHLNGVILSGGDDPSMEEFGEPTHPKAKIIHPDRQSFELELLENLQEYPEKPIFAICLGMQLMGLQGGGSLNQYLPDNLATAAEHWDGGHHPVSGSLGEGVVSSHHRQALSDPGRFDVVAQAPDGVIEAISDPNHPHFLGVQWHPERTDDPCMGLLLFERFLDACQKNPHQG